jgi:hypothetical protein
MTYNKRKIIQKIDEVLKVSKLVCFMIDQMYNEKIILILYSLFFI